MTQIVVIVVAYRLTNILVIEALKYWRTSNGGLWITKLQQTNISRRWNPFRQTKHQEMMAREWNFTLASATSWPWGNALLTLQISRTNTDNNCYWSYQRFDIQTRRKGQYGFALTRLRRFHASLNKGIFDRRLNCNESYCPTHWNRLWLLC